MRQVKEAIKANEAEEQVARGQENAAKVEEDKFQHQAGRTRDLTDAGAEALKKAEDEQKLQSKTIDKEEALLKQRAALLKELERLSNLQFKGVKPRLPMTSAEEEPPVAPAAPARKQVAIRVLTQAPQLVLQPQVPAPVLLPAAWGPTQAVVLQPRVAALPLLGAGAAAAGVLSPAGVALAAPLGDEVAAAPGLPPAGVLSPSYDEVDTDAADSTPAPVGPVIELRPPAKFQLSEAEESCAPALLAAWSSTARRGPPAAACASAAGRRQRRCRSGTAFL